MARKIDRYGRNRQFRRNPTRSPKFFPYRLPFQANFSANRSPSILDQEYDDGMYERMQYTQTPRKRKFDEYQEGLVNVRTVQRKGIEIALNGIPVGKSLAALDNALAAGIARGFAQHSRNNQLGFYNYWI